MRSKCDARTRTRSTNSAAYTSASSSSRRSFKQRVFVDTRAADHHPPRLPRLTTMRAQKEKEELDDLNTELELSDEDDVVP